MGQGLPTSSGLWKSGRGLRQARTSRGLPVWTQQDIYGPQRASAPLGGDPALGNSGISAVPGLRAYGHLPKDVSPGYSILLLTTK